MTDMTGMTDMASETLRAVDTSVILRYLLHDDPAQWRAAEALIDSETRLALTPVTLAEAAWVLSGPRLRIDRAVVAETLVRLLSRENIICVGFERREAQAALLRCQPAVGGAGLGDAILAACARSAGIAEIYTFDESLERAGLSPVAPATTPL